MHDELTESEKAGYAASSNRPENNGAGEAGGLMSLERPGHETPEAIRISKYPITEKMQSEISHRFKYHAPKPDQLPRYDYLRRAAKVLAEEIVMMVPPGREQALALTKLEEAIMHANSGIARGE